MNKHTFDITDNLTNARKPLTELAAFKRMHLAISKAVKNGGERKIYYE